MNLFIDAPAQVVAAVMTEFQAKRPRMVLVDHHGDVHVLRADSLMGQQHFARHPDHWVGTWDNQARRSEVAFQLYSRMLQLVMTVKEDRQRSRGPIDPFAAGNLQLFETPLPLQPGRAA